MASSILVFLIVLSVLILVHEFGHFFAARKFGIWVKEFGIGFPPKLFGKKKGDTLYTVNLFPIGGFVKLHGENSEEKVTSPKRSFINKGKKARAVVIAAGVIMNFLLAIAAFSIVYSFSGIPRQTNQVKVLEVNVGTPAQTAGILVGDVIKSFNGKDISAVEDFSNLSKTNSGKKVKLEIEREGEQKNITLKSRKEFPSNEGPLGLVISSTEIYFAPVWQRPFLGIYYGFKEALFWGITMVGGILSIFGGLFKGVAPEGLSGPVGIYAITSQAAQFGALSLINFVGILSVNLAILNIIPFPALDGGRLLFLVFEKIIGRKKLAKIESYANTTGMILLLAALVAITYKDVRGLIDAGSLSGFVDNVLR